MNKKKKVKNDQTRAINDKISIAFVMQAYFTNSIGRSFNKLVLCVSSNDETSKLRFLPILKKNEIEGCQILNESTFIILSA